MQVVSGPIGRERVHCEAPPTSELDNEMNRFFAWVNDASDHTDPVLRLRISGS